MYQIAKEIRFSRTTVQSMAIKHEIMLRQDNRFASGENNPSWNGGSSFAPYPLGWTKAFKEQIRYRDSYKCQLCGVPEIECNRRLHVHHIDYNKMNINLENLISLCQGCHMLTNYNRDYWTEYLKQKVVYEIKK